MRPSDGSVVNLQLRPGSTAGQFVGRPVMNFVENEQWPIALYTQNELRAIEPGNEAEVALKTIYPESHHQVQGGIRSCGRPGRGNFRSAARVPDAGPAPVPPGRFAVKLAVEEKDKDVFLAAGAIGIGAGEHGAPGVPAHHSQSVPTREHQARCADPEAALISPCGTHDSSRS